MLKEVKLGECINLTKLPKINAPNLESLDLHQTKIGDISGFLTEKYLQLKDLRLPKDLILIPGPGSRNYEQIIINRPTHHPIVPLNLMCNTNYFSDKTEQNLKEIVVDLSLVRNTEFLTFLNLVNVRSISFLSCHFERGLSRTLSKMDFKSFPNLTFISIKE